MSIVKIIECPRDAMQGVEHHIPVPEKVHYMKLLLQCGFDTLDCGSFVNPGAVPQMADTAEVLDSITEEKGNTKLLVIVANERGAREASVFEGIDYLGFPFSINETFQLRNANSTINEAFNRLSRIQEIAVQSGKKTVAYLSMAFGNPYGEKYDREDIFKWTEKFKSIGIDIISLADTVGSAKTEDVTYLYNNLVKQHPDIEFGAHFHAHADAWMPKISAAFDAGCRRFDGALKGYGGCPFASDKLTGNIPTEGLVSWLESMQMNSIHHAELQKSLEFASHIFQE
ncbi:MAG: hydroxymethylglutaryl-CoA lyase [Bacteroidetes bacterium]|nr:hydroxymethylglutaryl-CoA lyase [Bacteroidota bacterium]